MPGRGRPGRPPRRYFATMTIPAAPAALRVLAVCGSLGLIAIRFVPGPLGSLLNEGLLIIGWVANWKPIEIFLYDWRPMHHQREILGSLARMEIAFPEP